MPTLTLGLLDRQHWAIDVASLYGGALPAGATGYNVTLVSPRSAPTSASVWTATTYASGTATILLAGPQADSTGALVVTGSADLWIVPVGATDTREMKVGRITVPGAGSVAPLPPGYVSSVVGQTGAVTGAQIAADPALRAALVPKWKPSTAYASGEFVLNPSGQIVSANTAFTSGTTYSASNWTVTAGGTGGGTVSDATTTSKGVVQLAGDLAGTAAAPTVTKIGGVTPATVATSGAYADLSGKPAIPTVGAAGTAGAALSATDATTTNSRTPTAHAATHASAGSDPVTIASTQVTGLGTAATQSTTAFDASGAAAAAQAAAIAASAPRLTPTATKTAAYTAVVGDLALMNVPGGGTTLTLPTAPADKAQVGYRAIGATSAVPLVVNRGGTTDTLGTAGATSATLPMADEVVVLQYDAANTRWLGVSAVKTQASLDARYVAPLSRTGSGTAAPLSRINIRDYGAVADARTLSDVAMTAASTQLTSASASFTAAADVGKTIVVAFAGPIVTTTTSAALTTGGAITSIAVAALPATLPAGTIVLTSGANVQAFQTTGAASGATAIPVASATPYFAFPSGTTAATTARPLKTTISAVTDAHTITLATAASTAVTAQEAIYGTNNLTAIQAAINAAGAATVPLYIPSAGTADGYLYDGLLTVATNLAIDGDGVLGVHTTGGAGLYPDNMPSQAPYLTGSVLIQAAQDTDAIQFTKGFSVNPLKNFGIRFAGKFVATGHGLRWNPPITTSTYQDNGLMDSVLEGLTVYGHDGNHYGYNVMNSLYCTFINNHSFGGGGLLMDQNSNSCSCGNLVAIHQYSVMCVGGSAQGVLLRNSVAFGQLNYCTFLRSQTWAYSGSSLVTAGYPAPTSAQFLNTTSSASVGSSTAGMVSNNCWIFPDQETNVGSVSNYTTAQGAGGGIIIHGGVGLNWNTGSELTTATQNLTGAPLWYQATYDLIPSPGQSADVILETGATNNPTNIVVHEAAHAATAASGGTTSAALSTGGPITSIPVVALTAAISNRANIALVSGANRQTFTVTAAANVGDTTITVGSTTPTFAFPSGSSFYMPITRTVQCLVLPGQFLRSVSTNCKYATYGNTAGMVLAV